jgi:uncharacterized protein DUF4136
MSRFFAPAVAVLVAACASGTTVQTQRDAAVPVPQGATWAWGRAERTYEAERDRLATDPELTGMITTAMERELAAHGYRMADSSQATLLVHYHLGARRQREETSDVTNVAPGPCTSDYCRARYNWGTWGMPENNFGVTEYREGMLLVDVVDRASGKVAWSALYKTRIDNPATTIEERQQRVTGAVHRALAGLPKVN